MKNLFYKLIICLIIAWTPLAFAGEGGSSGNGGGDGVALLYRR